MIGDLLALALAVVLLALNAFFVGSEFALVSARRSAIEPRAEEGSRRARIALYGMEHVSLMMAGAQLGITVCTLGLGVLGEPAIAHLLEGPFRDLGIPTAATHAVAFAIAIGLIGILHVVLGEMVPKNLALAGPDRAVLVLAPPLVVIVRVLHPAISALNGIANALLRLVGIAPRAEVASAFTRDEVAGLVEESRREGLLDPSESHVLVEALKFEERDARSVLLPLEQVVTVRDDVTPAEVERLTAQTGYSRFPVRDRGGAFVGYLHLKDALELRERHRNRPIAQRWIRPLPPVRPTDRLRSVLATMQRSGAHLAQVVGSDGATVGVVALEDVLEELVGEIRDENQRAA